MAHLFQYPGIIYKENYDKDYHFEIYTAGVRTVMERVRDYLSDIGFVYVMEQQKKEFQYELAKTSVFLHLLSFCFYVSSSTSSANLQKSPSTDCKINVTRPFEISTRPCPKENYQASLPPDFFLPLYHIFLLSQDAFSHNCILLLFCFLFSN